jgi:hypothetical protein
LTKTLFWLANAVIIGVQTEMHYVKKSLSCALLIIIMVIGFALAGTIQVSAEAPGIIIIIGSDTTWTKADSPHTLTGPVFVSNGATLTIEAGATVDLNSYYLLVNGTLRARGTSAEKIHITNCEQIEFTQYSNDWNKQTDSGCIIENAVLNSIEINIDDASPKISSNVFEDIEIFATVGGSPIISYNTITNGIISAGNSSVISDNTITDGGISIGRGSTSSGFPVISNNSINGGERGIYCSSGYAYISGNSISGCTWGIQLSTEEVFGGSWPSYPIVERNLITHNDYGITIALGSRFSVGTAVPTILNNTISDNSVGIYVSQSNYEASPTITYNNIHDNSNYNIQLSEYTENDVNATYNWWGSVDTQVINLTIYDYKFDFGLGRVDFVPFLTEPNPEEMSTPIPEFPSWLLVPLFLVATLAIIVVRKRLVC